MQNVIILVKAGEPAIGRPELERIQGCEYEVVQELLDDLHPDGRQMHSEFKIQIWTMNDFMDNWNELCKDDADVDYQLTQIHGTFMGYAKVKHP